MQEGKKSRECRGVSGELEKPVEEAPAGEKGQEFLFWGKLRSHVSTDLPTVLSAGWQRQRIHTVPTDSHWVCWSNHLRVDYKMDTFTVGDRQTDRHWAGSIPVPTAASSDRMCCSKRMNMREKEYEYSNPDNLVSEPKEGSV